MKNIFFMFLLLINIFSCSFSKEQITISTTSSEIAWISSQILKIAYNKIGYQATFIDMPAKRSLYEASSGRTDGEAHRIIEVEDKFPNLIRIDIPINYFEIRVFSGKYDISVNNFEQLKSYNFATRRGILIFEKYLKDFNVVFSNETSQVFKILNAKRVDFALSTDVTGISQIKSNKYPNVKMLEPALETIYLYHYLHKKNAHIVPQITKILEEMKENGEIQKIRDDSLRKLISTK